MRVGEVARRTGIGVSTLRAWERRHGILQPVRSASGQRLYSEDDVERVAAVCRLVAEGLTLSAAAGRVAAAGTGALSTGEGEELLLHQIVQAADQGIWVSHDGRTRYANRRMAELMGCSIDDLLARPVLEFVDPASLDEVRERGPQVRNGHRQQFETRLRRADGSSFVAAVSTTPLRNRSGTYDGAVAVVADVTARNRVDSEARLRTALLDSIEDAVVASYPDGTIAYVNPAAEQVFGWRAIDLVGQNGLELLAAPGARKQATQIHAKLLAKKQHTEEIRLTRRDGTQFISHMRSAPVLDRTGALIGLTGIFRDNSARARLEHQVRTRDLQAETISLLGARALRGRADDDHDLNLVLIESVEASRRVLQTDSAALLDVMPGGNELTVRISSPPSQEPTVPAGSRSLTGYTVLARKVVLVDDARTDRRFDIHASPDRPEIVSAVCAPVFGPSGVRAILAVASATPNKFDRSDVHFVQNMANVVGIAYPQA